MEVIGAIVLALAILWILKKWSELREGTHASQQATKTYLLRIGGGGGNYDMEIVGESHYLNNLRSIAGSGEVRHYCDAILRMEDENPHDSNAVAVYIEGLKVGYLRREIAKGYREQVEPHGKLDGTCGAVIVGGAEGRPNLGVWLDLPVNE
ncbi:HIRAN domain-containing protein [Pseudoxanthomonas sp. Soil82]|uniref:HIRAN domain-containing protein n=1 Tax=Pseudoxanthomonas sp. Soil82 TaxID=3157341 RepID=UPI00338E6A63